MDEKNNGWKEQSSKIQVNQEVAWKAYLQTELGLASYLNVWVQKHPL